MGIQDLPTLNWRGRVDCQKPSARIEDRIAYKREREAKGRAFRAAVWARDKGICQHCGRKVVKTLALSAERGEVHHLKGRRVAPEDVFNPDRAVLLCAGCHGRAQRHEIVVKVKRS